MCISCSRANSAPVYINLPCLQMCHLKITGFTADAAAQVGREGRAAPNSVTKRPTTNRRVCVSCVTKWRAAERGGGNCDSKCVATTHLCMNEEDGKEHLFLSVSVSSLRRLRVLGVGWENEEEAGKRGGAPCWKIFASFLPPPPFLLLFPPLPRLARRRRKRRRRPSKTPAVSFAPRCTYMYCRSGSSTMKGGRGVVIALCSYYSSSFSPSSFLPYKKGGNKCGIPSPPPLMYSAGARIISGC